MDNYENIDREEELQQEHMEEVQLQIKGRHDPCIVPRAVPCVEAAAAVAILDLLCRM